MSVYVAVTKPCDCKVPSHKCCHGATLGLVRRNEFFLEKKGKKKWYTIYGCLYLSITVAVNIFFHLVGYLTCL